MTSSDGPLHKKIDELWSRQEIYDCLMRYCRGGDRLDAELMASAYHPDAIEEHGKFVGPAAEFVDFAVKRHAETHLTHQHYVMNHQCEIEGDTAHSETYFMFVAMHKHGDKVMQIGGGRYLDRFERRDGKWAIAYRLVMRDWAMVDERPDMSDLSAFTSTRASLPPEVLAFMNQGFGPRRDRSDPSYIRPLEADPARIEAYKRLMQKL